MSGEERKGVADYNASSSEAVIDDANCCNSSKEGGEIDVGREVSHETPECVLQGVAGCCRVLQCIAVMVFV